MAGTDTLAPPRSIGVGAAHFYLPALCLLSLAFAVVLERHTPGLNGPDYWQWPWRRVDAWRLLATLGPALAPMAVGVTMHALGRWTQRRALVAVMVSAFLVQFAVLGLLTDPFGLTRLKDIVTGATYTSYYTEAVRGHDGPLSLRAWLDALPGQMAGMATHARTKPPGLTLYYWGLVRLFGPGEGAAVLGGVGVAILATLSVPATAWFIRTVAGDETRGLSGACFVALSPSLAMFLPEFDQFWPTLTCGLVGLWWLALERRTVLAAAACGAVLGLSCFFLYNHLVLGFVMLGMCAVWWLAHADRSLRVLARQAAIVLGVAIALQALAAVALSYHPIDTFRAALASEKDFARTFVRPYPKTAFYDVTDFALGAGWLAVPLAILGFLRTEGTARRLLLGLCLLQPVVVGLTGLLPGENARVWAFLLPVLMLGVDEELSRWRPGARAAAIGLQALALVAICRNMVFLQ
ncbi:MAG: hypothetical protein QM765_33565 [Myxococcales bacterium]